jgi:secondary thiamine-phosphate synthase enzyme
MTILTEKIQRKTRGNGDLQDITQDVVELLRRSRMQEGNITLFVVGSTAALTTFEYEPGLIKDLQEFYDRLAPINKPYHHDQTWGDANGFSHVRASFTGPSLVVPFEQGHLDLGTWQQVVLAEFDNRPRERTVVVQIMGV